MAALRRMPVFLGMTLLVLGIFLSLTVVRGMAMPEFEEAIITGDQVNMRLRPSKDSPVVVQFSKSARVGVFCEETDGWYRIIYGNYRGYVRKEYVFLSSTDVLVGNVIADGAKLYTAAGAFGGEAGTLSVGTGVTIRSVSGDYYEVESGEGDKGFVQQRLIQTTSAKAPVTMLKEGMKGVEVKKMQTELRKRGFLASSATGEFAEKTKQAVVDFQKAAKISADGVAGAKTLELLYGDNDIKTTPAKKAGITGKVELSHWDTIKNVLKRGTECKIYDVKTGISFRARRFGGWYHADSEPLTKADSAAIKKAAGGKWSWNRRAIWVTVGNRTFAASMHSMPHMANPTRTNGFDGHFCIHFNGSKVHENSKACPRHQKMVQYAYNAAQ